MVGTLLFLRPLMKLFGAKGETLELAIEYTRIIAIGMPFQIFGAGASMFVRADGSPTYAMTSTLAGAILNVILDPVFIFGMNMGMTGAALATIIGQIVGALIALSYFREFKSAELNQEAFIPRFSCLKGICILGLPAGLMQIAVMVVQIVMNNTLGYYDEQTIYGRYIPLAVSGVVTKINSIFTATVMVFVKAVSLFLDIITAQRISHGSKKHSVPQLLLQPPFLLFPRYYSSYFRYKFWKSFNEGTNCISVLAQDIYAFLWGQFS